MKWSIKGIAVAIVVIAVGVFLGLLAFALWGPESVRLVG
jgi:hypothetical protein